jgi:hypothetical protein
LHYYFYFEDGKFGLTQVRLMTWFPFDVRIVINGREWLAQEMDRRGIGYLRRDNCFVNIDNFAVRGGWPRSRARSIGRDN